jgi:carbonic anhydrase
MKSTAILLFIIINAVGVHVFARAGPTPQEKLQAKLIANAMRAAAADEWNHEEPAGDTMLLESASKLRGGASRAAEQMKVIRSNMQILQNNKRMMEMEPLGSMESTNTVTKLNKNNNNSSEGDSDRKKAEDAQLQNALVTDLNSTSSDNDELTQRKEGIEEALNVAKSNINDQPVSHMTMKQVLKHQKNLAKVLSHLDSTHAFLKKQLERARESEANRLSKTTSKSLETVMDKLVEKRIEERLSTMDGILQKKIDTKIEKETESLATKVEQIAGQALRKNVMHAVKDVLDSRKATPATAQLDKHIMDRVKEALDKRLSSEVHADVMNATEGLDGLKLTNMEESKGFEDFRNNENTHPWKKDQHNSSEIVAVHPDGSDAHIDPKKLRLDVNGQPDFAYGSTSGAYSPMNWGHVSPKYETCANGREQSPINIRKPTQLTKKSGANVHVRPELPDLQVAYEPFVPSKVIHNGHAPMVAYPSNLNASLVYDGDAYLYKQFHIHSPGEHAIDGVRPAMSLHLVHESKHVREGMNNRFALVAVGFEVAKAGEPFLDGFFNRLPAPPQPGSTEPTFISLNDIKLSLASAIFDAPEGQNWAKVPSTDFYTYHGSLSTPPCTEDVKYFIMKQPLRVTSDQISKLRAILPYGENARPLMNSQWTEEPVVYTKTIVDDAVSQRRQRSTKPSQVSSSMNKNSNNNNQAVNYSNNQRFRAVNSNVVNNDESLVEGAKDASEVLREMKQQQ